MPLSDLTAACYSIESSTASAVALTSLPTPRTVFAQDDSAKAEMITASVASLDSLMVRVSHVGYAQIEKRSSTKVVQ